MSEIVGFVGMSHSPFATLLPPAGPDDPGAPFLADAARVRDAVARLAPDAVVVVGPDHFHGNFYDVMPPFVLGVEEAVGFGDYGSTSGPLPVAGDLAWSVYDGLTDAGFDLALSYALTVDHGIVQGYEMVTGGTTIPLVPLVVNTAAPPLPTLARCVALGDALGKALAAGPAGRVLVVASGGLSHWLPSNDPRDPSVVGEKRASLIHGRQDAQAFAAAREPKVRAMGGDPDARVNDAWDRWFLDRLTAGDLDAIAALGHEGLEEAAGTGGHEIRTWLIGAAAVATPLAWTSYEPVPEWITGMGSGATFAVP
ncbi:2,3-dihydroxyphenylpropionate 1,2-dioxygenase [Actinomycetospora sp. NBRC 106375]|uniref:DODA-type extradiol aromatic ring-opening family dioxygenase n=1 Tax=Actinomycetospora sp. NBRC 106375 TaxID=3032207 RepID=UPI0024A12756|nr:2,3-dihydroxyphenylpropionate 1,2-dioxygenase [Actinomycetospora sp. NBRC 106375]GLZ47700.1 2,3-dihydroxyphenylpropionate 1,2-dioxygenase [Actinomycetospora sp. NBRC 106375]